MLICMLMCALTVGRQVRQELAESQRQVLELKKTNYTLQQQLSMRVGDFWSLSEVQLCNAGTEEGKLHPAVNSSCP